MSIYNGIPVIVTTSSRDLPVYHYAKTLGSSNILLKPFDAGRLRSAIERVPGQSKPPEHFEALRSRLVGDTPCFLKVLTQAAQMIRYPQSRILLLGERGTGKTALAKAIHEVGVSASANENKYVRCNVVAVQPSLLENELFGHEEEAYTGAMSQREGVLERAAGGTLFLDEIGEIPPATQAKLLVALDKDGTFFRVGGKSSVNFRARLICATNMDLSELVANGKLRPDLYDRIAGCVIHLPSLRERAADVQILACQYVLKTSKTSIPRRLSEDALKVLQRTSFNGNVRELETVLEGAMRRSYDDIIPPEAVLEEIEERSTQGGVHSRPIVEDPLIAGFQWPKQIFKLGLKDAERTALAAFDFAYISWLLANHSTWEQAAAAASVYRETPSDKLHKAKSVLESFRKHNNGQQDPREPTP